MLGAARVAAPKLLSRISVFTERVRAGIVSSLRRSATARDTFLDYVNLRLQSKDANGEANHGAIDSKTPSFLTSL